MKTKNSKAATGPKQVSRKNRSAGVVQLENISRYFAESNRRTAFVVFAALLVMTWAAFGPSLRGGFLWDDDAHVVAPSLRSLSGLEQIWTTPRATLQYYPLTFSVFWLEYHLWGLQPLGYRVVNLLLHAANAFLLWLVLRRLSVRGAVIAAALFAVHPVHTETVAWIAELKNTLSTFFYFLAGLAYIRYCGLDETGPKPAPGSRRHYWLALAAYVAALCSKTVTVSFPPVMLVVTWWRRGRIGRRDIIDTLPFFALGFAAAGMTAWMESRHVGAQGEEWAFTFIERVLIASRAVCFYIWKLIWPVNLSFIYRRWTIDQAITTLYIFPLLLTAALSVLWFKRKSIGRCPLAALVIFMIAVFPALGFVNVYPMRFSFVADHFQYLASVSIFALLGTLFWMIPARLIRVATAAAVVCLLIVFSNARSRAFLSQDILWRDTIAKNPGAWLAHHNLSNILLNEGRLPEAEQHNRVALELRPAYSEAYVTRGMLHQLRRETAEAQRNYERALELNPDMHSALGNLSVLAAQRGENVKALELAERGLALAPDAPSLLVNKAAALQNLKLPDEALKSVNRAIEIEPGVADFYVRRAMIYGDENNTTATISDLENALRLNSPWPEVEKALNALRALN